MKSEIWQLRRQDQHENLWRRNSFHKVQQQKAINDLEQKILRSDFIKSEKKKLGDLTYKQRQ